MDMPKGVTIGGLPNFAILIDSRFEVASGAAATIECHPRIKNVVFRVLAVSRSCADSFEIRSFGVCRSPVYDYPFLRLEVVNFSQEPKRFQATLTATSL